MSLIQPHSLTFTTERGSLKIEIEEDLNLFKQLKASSSDSYFFEKINEIKNEIILLNELKFFNDIIWNVTKFKTHIGTSLNLYQREDGTYFSSLIAPDEWSNPEYFLWKGNFTLTTKGIWEKK